MIRLALGVVFTKVKTLGRFQKIGAGKFKIIIGWLFRAVGHLKQLRMFAGVEFVVLPRHGFVGISG